MKRNRFALTAVAASICGWPVGLPGRQAEPPREITKYDLEAIEKAKAKRERKAKQKQRNQPNEQETKNTG